MVVGALITMASDDQRRIVVRGHERVTVILLAALPETTSGIPTSLLDFLCCLQFFQSVANGSHEL
jgi:hypothetical protein